MAKQQQNQEMMVLQQEHLLQQQQAMVEVEQQFSQDSTCVADLANQDRMSDGDADGEDCATDVEQTRPSTAKFPTPFRVAKSMTKQNHLKKKLLTTSL